MGIPCHACRRLVKLPLALEERLPVTGGARLGFFGGTKMRSFGRCLAACAAVVCSPFASAAVVMTPLSTFGTNGWLAPGSSAYLGTGNNERGIGFGNGHVYLVSHANVSG